MIVAMEAKYNMQPSVPPPVQKMQDAFAYPGDLILIP